MVKFLRDVKIELSKVTYPSRDEVVRLTLLVIVMSIIIGAYMGALDYAFTLFLEYVVG